jgi:hypothetical protein
MMIYSPKAQNPDVFKKNTVKNKITYSHKVVTSGTTIEFENIKKESEEKDDGLVIKRNPLNRLCTYMKDQFYNRMKVFFEFEDKYREKPGVFGFIEKP